MPDANPPATHSPVVTRFAPSPTGALHVGGARTALYAWAFARGRGGRFILRFEDTDQKRSSVASVRGILRDLAWLGIDWDEGPDPHAPDPLDRATQRGPHGPYFQSQAKEDGLYDAAVDQLRAAGRAYDKDGAVWFRMGIFFHDAVYGEIVIPNASAEDFVIRKADGFPTFHLAVVVDDMRMGVTHVIRGQEHLSNTPRHVALFDALGYPRPVFAHIPSIMNPDGSKMSKRDKAKVARAAALTQLGGTSKTEFLATATRRALMHDIYLQLRAGVKADSLDKQRFSDADIESFASTELEAFMRKDSEDIVLVGAIAHAARIALPEIEVHDFRRSGYLAPTLCNYLALLGWNPGNDVERFGRDFLAQRFDFDRVNKGNSKFDRAKLVEFNRQDLAAMSPEAFTEALWGWYVKPSVHPRPPVVIFEQCADERFRWFAEAVKPRCRTFAEPFRENIYLFETFHYPKEADKNIQKSLLHDDYRGVKLLDKAQHELRNVVPWNPPTIQQTLEAFVAQHQLKNIGEVAQPLRVAISGTTVTPPIDLTLAVLGRDLTLQRIEACITWAKSIPCEPRP